MKATKPIKQLVALFLAAVLMLSGVGQPVGAAENRTAKIEDVIGTVWIIKAGGNLPIRAYPGARLGQEDRVITENFSSVKLVISDTHDELTITQNADLVLTDLRNEAGKKVTKLLIWAGSVLSNVNPDKNRKDVFEVNTPGQSIGAKGTLFLVTVDPGTGRTTLSVLDGIVGIRSDSDTGSDKDRQLIHPAQQTIQYPDEIGATVEFLNFEDLNSQLTLHMLEQIASLKDKFDKENEEFIEETRRQLLNGTSLDSLLFNSVEELQRYERNIQFLMEHILQAAIDSGKSSSADIERIIREANRSLEQPINLGGREEWILTERERERQRALDDARRQREEAQKRELEERKNSQAALLQKIENERKQQEERIKKALEDAKRAATERLREGLDPDAKAELDARLRDKELERQRQQDAANRERERTAPPPVVQPSSPPERPTPPISVVERNLNSAKAQVPVSAELYTSESWGRIEVALGLGESTDEEKIVKTEELLNAISGLVTQVDQNLMNAINSVPSDSELYSDESWFNLMAALDLPEETAEDKVAKAETIWVAISNLIERDRMNPEMVLAALNDFYPDGSEEPIDFLTSYSDVLGIDFYTVDDEYERFHPFAESLAYEVFYARPEEGFSSIDEFKEIYEQLLLMNIEFVNEIMPDIKEINVSVIGSIITLSWENEEGYRDIRIFIDGEPIWESNGIEYSATFAIELSGERHIHVEFRHSGSDWPQAISESIPVTLER
ncbi:FecR domain-containing protein [Sporosarcina sp. FSL W8-0480]|uniref:FecR domain-containing protein n=1 Tax=Sporosarcina sp. FSL W8-0480 TaxID=2954701 RepID=UPI0030D8D2E2